jgi:N-acetylneuraminic acid mutarotase
MACTRSRTDGRPWTLALTVIGFAAVALMWILAMAAQAAEAGVDQGVNPDTPGVKPAAAALPDLPLPVASFGADRAGDFVYVYGGHCADPHQYHVNSQTGRFHRLNLTKNNATWEALPQATPLQGVVLVAHGGKLYRVGGMHASNQPDARPHLHSVAQVARFDPASGKWEDCTPLPAPRSSHDAALLGDHLYVVGGWRLDGASVEGTWDTTALVADLRQWPLKWQRLADPPFKRRALALAAAEGKLLAVGGIEPSGKTTNAACLYDPAGDKWTAVADLPSAGRFKGFGSAAAGHAGRILVSGRDGKVFAFDLGRSKWFAEPVATLAEPRFFHRFIPLHGERWLALGGASGAGALVSAEIVLIRTP